MNQKGVILSSSDSRIDDADSPGVKVVSDYLPPGCCFGEHLTGNAGLLYCAKGELTFVLNFEPRRITAKHLALATSEDLFYFEAIVPSSTHTIIIEGVSATGLLREHGLWGGVIEAHASVLGQVELLLHAARERGEQRYLMQMTHNLLATLGNQALMYASDKRVYRVQTHFHHHWRNPQTTVSSTLAHLELAYSSISGRFRQVTGRSLLNYLTWLRLQYACLTLKSGICATAETALKCGFQDPAYFCRLFKSKLGVCPQQVASLSVTEYALLMKRLHLL